MLFFFDVPLEAALVRNAGRNGRERVPDIALRGTYGKLERPTESEGFDEIFIVTNELDGAWKVSNGAGCDNLKDKKDEGNEQTEGNAG